MSKNSILIRQLWDSRKTKNINYSKRPVNDMLDDMFIAHLDRIENVKLRLKDLSKFLVLFYGLYKDKYDLYGDDLLAFIGDKVIRHWPWKDFPFTSIEAQDLLANHNITGLTKNDSDIKKLKPILNHLRYEHWTPLSFFRDAFIIAKENNLKLTDIDFYDLLIENYRIVWITKEEDSKKLGGKYKSKRTVKTYDELGIKISDKKLWDKLYKK